MTTGGADRLLALSTTPNSSEDGCDLRTRRGRDISLDEALLLARAGDEDAFSRLWRWLHPSLVRWLRVAAPGGADDVAADVWTTVARGLPTFDGGEREFRAWVFTTARRRAIDWGRRRRRQPRLISLDGADIADHREPEHGVGVEDAVSMLRTISADQAQAIALRVIAGLTVHETAQVIGKSEGAVRALCHRGLRALARQLSPADPARGDGR